MTREEVPFPEQGLPLGTGRRKLVRQIVAGGVLGSGIKVMGVGLAFLFFLTIARVTTAEGYGVFAAAFSLATILGFAATLGQHTAILRFWPALDEAYGPDMAVHAIRRGLYLTLAGGTVPLVLFTLLALHPPGIAAFGGNAWVYPMTGLMAFAFALSEFSVAALRARGSLLWALGPREIFWRLGVIVLVLLLARPLGGEIALGVSAAMLIAVTLPQAARLVGDIFDRKSGAPTLPENERARMRHATWGLWGGATVGPILHHANTLVVALVLGPAAAGAFFAANQLGKLLSIALIGVNQIAGPELSRSYHGGRIEEVRLTSTVAAAFAFAVALAGFAVFVIAGRFALALFDPAYADAYWVLIILGAAQLINTACGPNGLLLNMAGKERVMFAIMSFWGVSGIVLVWTGAEIWGMAGAAAGSAVTMIGWNATAIIACFRHLGVLPFSPNIARPAGRSLKAIKPWETKA